MQRELQRSLRMSVISGRWRSDDSGSQGIAELSSRKEPRGSAACGSDGCCWPAARHQLLINRFEAARGVIGILPDGARPRRPREAQTERFVGHYLTERCRERLRVADGYGECGFGRPLRHVPDGCAYRRHTDRRSLEDRNRTGLVTRGDDQHVSRAHQWQELPLCHETMESQPVGETELAREPLNLAAERILADDIHVEE